jgi:hypothetical protein
MPAAKLQSAEEFQRWWNEGRSYQWIIDEYLRKYNIEITPSAIGNWRARLGLPRRQERDVDLIPWKVEERHGYKHALAMLRAEGRRRAGQPISVHSVARLESWLKFLAEENAVVHYDPDTEEGFFYVPRRPGIDTDIIRVPEHSTRERGKRE